MGMHKKLVHTFTRAATPSIPRFWLSFRLSAASRCFCKASFRRLLAAAACKIVYTKNGMVVTSLYIYWLKTWGIQTATSNHIFQTFRNRSGVCSRYWLPTSSVLRRRTLACFWKSRSSLSSSYCLLRSCIETCQMENYVSHLNTYGQFHTSWNRRDALQNNKSFVTMISLIITSLSHAVPLGTTGS